MRVKKLIASLAAGLLVVSILGACGDDDDDDTGTDTTVTVETTVAP